MFSCVYRMDNEINRWIFAACEFFGVLSKFISKVNLSIVAKIALYYENDNV